MTDVLISDDEDDETAINVPLTVTVAVIGGYIFLGALLYKYWEDWTMLEVPRVGTPILLNFIHSIMLRICPKHIVTLIWQ